MVFEIQAFLWFAIIAKNSKTQNGRHFWWDKYFLKIGSATQQSYPKGKKKSVEIALSSTVFQISEFFFKNSKIQNGRHFWQVKYSLKLGKATLHRHPMGQKFCQICSIWHGFWDTSIFVFCNFCEKFENSKWSPFLMGQFFFENWVSYSAVALWVKKSVEIALSSTAFEI